MAPTLTVITGLVPMGDTPAERLACTVIGTTSGTNHSQAATSRLVEEVDRTFITDTRFTMGITIWDIRATTITSLASLTPSIAGSTGSFTALGQMRQLGGRSWTRPTIGVVALITAYHRENS